MSQIVAFIMAVISNGAS